ncbi:MAG: hypothetical protein ABL957_05260 [Parvularculaceae bacterium]
MRAAGTRNLLVVIITMPLVFIAVVAASLMIFGKPGPERVASEIVRSTPTSDVLEQPMLAAGVAAPLAASLGASAPFVLSAGEDITAMAVDGNRLVLRVKGDSGGAIVIYDLAQGAEVQRIRVLENPASGDNGL